MPNKPSNVKEAFSENANTVGLASLLAISLATLNPLPLLVGAVIEAGYLLFVPDSKWYAKRVEGKYDAAVRQRRIDLKEKVFPSLSRAEQLRFLRLEEHRASINPADTDKPYYRDVLRRLDYLLEKFLLFASKRHEFITYLKSLLEELKPPQIADNAPRSQRKTAIPFGLDVDEDVSEDWVKESIARISNRYKSEIEQMMNQSTTEQNLHNKALLEKRIEIVSRRQQYVERTSDILSNLTHQLQLMEDTFGLISDEIRARSPEQVLADIDDVVNQSDVLTQALEDVTPFEQMDVAQGAEQLYNLPK